MKSLDYVKSHIDEFEEDDFLDSRFTKRFVDFLPTDEWEEFGFRYTGDAPRVPKEWTEENVLAQLKQDVVFGFEKAVDERGISSELMAMVVNAWCKVLENGLNLNGDDGWYHKDQFTTVAKHYGWELRNGEQGNMMAYTNEPRPCLVDGSRALFHCWAEVEKPNIEDGKQVGRWKNVVAVIEFCTGEIKAVKPNEVRFLDGAEMFGRYDWNERG